jgi:hypothetical protein
VAIVLCIGLAVVVAAAMHTRLSQGVVRSLIVCVQTKLRSLPSFPLPSVVFDSPPIRLRI